jgi:RNA recognition motif-containing protein
LVCANHIVVFFSKRSISCEHGNFNPISILHETAVVMYDPLTRRSRQYAFVTFQDAEIAERMLSLTNLVIDGRVVEV